MDNPIPYGLRKKIKKIRWAFFYMVFSLIFWLLPGPFIFIVRLTSKKDWRESGINFTDRGLIGTIIHCFYSAQLVLQPIFFLYAHNQLSLWDWLQRCPLLSFICARAIRRKRERQRNTFEISSVMRMETYAATSQIQPTFKY